MRPRPWTLLVAAAAQAIEAVGVLVAAVVSAADTVSGHSYQRSSGIALTVLAFAAAIAVAFVVPGLLRVRLWSRTPALFTHLFVGTTGVYLLDGHHPALGWPALLVAIAGFAGLCAPPSWRALSRLGLREREELAAEAEAATEEPARPRPAKAQSSPRPKAAKAQPAGASSGKKASSRRR
jgi:peptidoglycan/LPS O-acetylase OafA/YrhL